MNSVIPDLEWYKAQNPLKGSPHRCPFGAAEHCPKYAASVSCLVKEQIWDACSEATATETLTDIKKIAIEDSPNIHASGGGNNWRRRYINFCPEVLEKAFGLFVSNLSNHWSDESCRENRRALLRQGIDESHPHYKWRDYKPQHYTDCDRYSILYGQRTQIPAPKYDMRGAQFGGGFSETTQGDQHGGQLNSFWPLSPLNQRPLK